MLLFVRWSKVEYSSALSELRALVLTTECCVGDVKLGSFERDMKALCVAI